MDGSGGPSGSWGLVPTWDGKPETFSHFICEVKWSLSASKREERPLLCAKIIRKALQTGQPTLVQLMYKLEPSDFQTEADIKKLIRYLEQCPLNRQALPDAGNKIGGYYRRLRRRNGETVPAFLVREDRIHDEMLRALQRLLREKSLDFDTYEVTMDELRGFCGFKPGQSLYFPNGEPDGDDEDAAEETGSQKSSSKTQSRRTATPPQQGRPFSDFSSGSPSGSRQSTPRRRQDRGVGSSNASTAEAAPIAEGKDLLQRLMEKGLIPLAALDVIRGWMVLEMSTQTDEDRRLIRAATRNRLGYTDIKQALLAMYEEKAHGIPLDRDRKGYGKGSSFFQESGMDYENEPEAVPAYGGDTYAVTEQGGLGYDDGSWNAGGWAQDAWWSSPADWSGEAWYQGSWDEHDQEQPDSGAHDPESNEEYAQLIREQEEAEKSNQELHAIMTENNRNLMEARRAVAAAAKDRGWNNPPQQRQGRSTSSYPGKGKSSFSHGKGKINYAGEDLAWVKGKPSKGYSGSKGMFQKGKFQPRFQKGPSKGKPDISYVNYMNDYHMFTLDEEAFAETNEDLQAGDSIVDTGATASAGGHVAVQDLCKAVMKEISGATMEVYTGSRPWFRYGSGKWGQALYQVILRYDDQAIPIYALPSPGVPVLLGMKELMSMGSILNCRNGHCIFNGRQKKLRMTKKRHMIVSFLTDVFSEQLPDEDAGT